MNIREIEAYWKISECREKMGIAKDEPIQFKLLAQGEYNINYKFKHPGSQKEMVFRINMGSQMHLDDQIEYEANALKILERSGRTPAVLYVDGSRKYTEYGVMIMEFLPGRPLDYRKDLQYAAECLADIHSISPEKDCGLICPDKPLQAILDECNEMIRTYDHSVLGDDRKKKQIHDMLEKGQEMADHLYAEDGYRCCINTELNSGNFLINGEGNPNYLIDWEKPLYGDPAQDLGHFLAPTTTFWKTDVILTEREMRDFVHMYRKTVGTRYCTDGIERKLKTYIPVTCLRGITWCAMAWVQYQSDDKKIRNEDTFKKMESYLSDDFLDQIEKRYFSQ